MNPWFLVGWAISLAGAFFYGTGVGQDREIAKQAAVEDSVRATREAAAQGVAGEIAKLKPQNTIIRGRVETIVRENTVYRDCRHTPDGLRVLNEALTGRAQPASDSAVPGVNAVN